MLEELGTLKKLPVSYDPTHFCGLCRQALVDSDCCEREIWRWKFRVVFEHEPGDVAISAVLATDPYDDSIVSVLDRDFQICVRTFERSWMTSPPCYSCHDWCYSMAVGMGKLNLFKFLKAATTPSRLWTSRYDQKPWTLSHMVLYHYMECSVDQDDRLRFINKLPSEVQKDIWDRVMRYPKICAQVTLEQAAYLFSKRVTPKRQLIQFSAHSKLKIDADDFFGQKIIRAISLDPSEDAYMVPGDVMSIELAVNYSGISAIQLRGAEWQSPWLGEQNPSADWYATVDGPALDCHFNEFACLDIDRSFVRDSVWSVPGFSLVAGENPLGHFEYVSFYRQQEYMQAITIYQTRNGVAGLETYFEGDSVLVGDRVGRAVHFLMHPDERITSIWTRTTEAQALVIITNQGRTFDFGFQRDQTYEPYIWKQLRGSSDVLGIYWRSSDSKHFVDFALHSGPGKVNDSCHIPSYPKTSLRMIFTTAKLESVSSIQACKFSGRHIGLKISYFDGSVAILGQYRTDSTTSYEVIFDERDGVSLGSLVFKLCGDECFVYRVRVSQERSIDDHHISYGDEIVWWIGEHGDRIEISNRNVGRGYANCIGMYTPSP